MRFLFVLMMGAFARQHGAVNCNATTDNDYFDCDEPVRSSLEG